MSERERLLVFFSFFSFLFFFMLDCYTRDHHQFLIPRLSRSDTYTFISFFLLLKLQFRKKIYIEELYHLMYIHILLIFIYLLVSIIMGIMIFLCVCILLEVEKNWKTWKWTLFLFYFFATTVVFLFLKKMQRDSYYLVFLHLLDR